MLRLDVPWPPVVPTRAGMPQFNIAGQLRYSYAWELPGMRLCDRATLMA